MSRCIPLQSQIQSHPDPTSKLRIVPSKTLLSVVAHLQRVVGSSFLTYYICLFSDADMAHAVSPYHDTTTLHDLFYIPKP